MVAGHVGLLRQWLVECCPTPDSSNGSMGESPYFRNFAGERKDAKYIYVRQASSCTAYGNQATFQARIISKKKKKEDEGSNQGNKQPGEFGC